uniref:Uncharacterized protein n=1 Tax=Noccaea caerulescens TaxID=107243 RepID=A0A1J3JUB6_NOCCA
MKCFICSNSLRLPLGLSQDMSIGKNIPASTLANFRKTLQSKSLKETLKCFRPTESKLRITNSSREKGFILDPHIFVSLEIPERSALNLNLRLRICTNLLCSASARFSSNFEINFLLVDSYLFC